MMKISSRAAARTLAHARRYLQKPAPQRSVVTRADSQADTPSSANDEVAAAFARRIASDPNLAPPRAPSPLHSPTTVSRALCSALQRPDSPEAGAGSRVAFDFTLPLDVAPAAPVLAGAGRKARSWHAKETFMGFEAFAADSLAAPPADAFENCESWELVGDLVFTGRGSVSGIGDCSKAAQAVSITAATAAPAAGRDGSSGGKESEKSATRKYTATILLTRVDDAGPWKGCWLVYGMRTGNYCSV